MQRKGPLPGKIFARCILQRRFAGLFGYMARISCQSQLISDAWRANLARKGRFSRPRPLLGYIERKTCHGLPPGDAPRRNLATDRHSGTHQGIILPWPAARKCTAATSCHGSLLQECFSTTYCQEGPRLPGLAAKSQWCHEVGRPRPNVTSANSTPHADTSKKP